MEDVSRLLGGGNSGGKGTGKAGGDGDGVKPGTVGKGKGLGTVGNVSGGCNGLGFRGGD